MRKTLAFVLLASSFAALPLACSAKKPNPPITPVATVDAGDAGDAGEGGALMMATGDGGAEAGPLLVATGDAGPVSPGNLAEMMDPAIDLAIKAAAASAAPGMTAEGAPLRATLAEGEHAFLIVTLAPGRCYTVVGFSPNGQITNLSTQILMGPLFNAAAGTSGANDKNTPVIGRTKQNLCPILPIPMAYKIDAQAKKGAGRMAVQLFAKNK
jgi:hypothetical protein